MTLDAAELSPRGDGLRTVVDTIAAPGEAFDALRTSPTWGWAAAILAILCAISFFLERPGQLHATTGLMQHMFASPAYASLSDDQKRKMLADAQNPPPLNTLLGLVGAYLTYGLAALFNTVFLLVGNALGKGSARFSSLWAASVNIAVPSIALGGLVLGIIMRLRGPESFNGMGDILRAVPGPGMLAPGIHGFAGAFLASITVFTLWGCYLNVVAMKRTARVNGPLAYVVPILILLASAAISGAFFGAFGA